MQSIEIRLGNKFHGRLKSLSLLMMIVKSIQTEKDYQAALQRLEVIFDAKSNTVEGDELEVLGVLIDEYEKVNLLKDF